MMKSVVITGSTRGIGLGMAEAFLRQECQVVINGRSQDSIDRGVWLVTTHGLVTVFSEQGKNAWALAAQRKQGHPS